MKLPSNVPPPKDSKELSKHFSDTYFKLRMGLAIFAFATPIVLWGVGKFVYHLDLQPSMSSYFWAASIDQCATFPMRTIFAGFLFALGVSLYMYKGLTNLENTLLNVAGICALAVAIFPEGISPTEAASDPRVAQLFQSCPAIKTWAELPPLHIHYPAAVLLFFLLAVVAWFCADKSLEYLPANRDPAKYRRIYKAIAIAMLLFWIPGIAVAYLFGAPTSKVFFIEAAGVITFGIYWLVKSRELALSRLEKDPTVAVQHAAQRQAR